MIKLKTLLAEIRKFKLDKIEDAAEYMVRQTWKYMSRDDKFDNYQFFLRLDNEEPLMRQFDVLAKKLFPNEKHPEDKFINVINDKLEELEREKHTRMAKKINTLDPLFFLKQIVRRKTYEGAKQTLISNSLGSWAYSGGKVGDEPAEEVFNRLYKNAMGETVYDEKRANQYGRLSDLRKTEIRGRNEDNVKQYSVNMFIDHYTGYKLDRFPSKVKVYRGAHSPLATIRPGDYVTFDKRYAGAYVRGKFGSIISDVVDN